MAQLTFVTGLPLCGAYVHSNLKDRDNEFRKKQDRRIEEIVRPLLKEAGIAKKTWVIDSHSKGQTGYSGGSRSYKVTFFRHTMTF